MLSIRLAGNPLLWQDSFGARTTDPTQEKRDETSLARNVDANLREEESEWPIACCRLLKQTTAIVPTILNPTQTRNPCSISYADSNDIPTPYRPLFHENTTPWPHDVATNSTSTNPRSRGDEFDQSFEATRALKEWKKLLRLRRITRNVRH